MTTVRRLVWSALVLGGLLAPELAFAQVTYDRILRAAEEPENWLTYNGTYSSQRYSSLRQITPANVVDMESKWMLQTEPGSCHSQADGSYSAHVWGRVS